VKDEMPTSNNSARRSSHAFDFMNRIAVALFLSGLSTAALAMDFHPGKYPTLKLQRISQKDLMVELKGYVVVTGKIEASWEAGEDGVPLYPSYSLVPDADAAAKMPTVDDYRVTSIQILNGADALRMFAGPDAAKSFEQRKILRITAVGTFKLTHIGMGPECGQLQVAAQIESITGIAQLALLATAAPMSFC